MRRQLGAILGTTGVIAATVMGGVAAHGQDRAGASNVAAHSSMDTLAAKTIIIRDFSFMTPRRVAPGVRVLVENQGEYRHTVNAYDPPYFQLSVEAGERGHFRAPKKPGTYRFYCTQHPEMRGMLVVRKPR
jgi:plastocyanin